MTTQPLNSLETTTASLESTLGAQQLINPKTANERECAWALNYVMEADGYESRLRQRNFPINHATIREDGPGQASVTVKDQESYIVTRLSKILKEQGCEYRIGHGKTRQFSTTLRGGGSKQQGGEPTRILHAKTEDIAGAINQFAKNQNIAPDLMQIITSEMQRNAYQFSASR